MALLASFLNLTLILMQLVSVSGLTVSPTFLRNGVAVVATQSHKHITSQAPDGVVEPFSDQMLEVWNKKDELEFRCDQAQEKDAEIIEDLESESRKVGGDVAGNMAKVSSASATELRLRGDEETERTYLQTAKRNCDVERTHMKLTEKTFTGDEKTARMAAHRSAIESCELKQQECNAQIQALRDDRSRVYEEVTRLQGIGANLAAEKASVVQRLEGTKRDADQWKVKCEEGVAKYRGDLEDLKKQRQEAANTAAGEKVIAGVDCEVTNWVFLGCSTKCKKDADDPAGSIKAKRNVLSPPMYGGMNCPKLTAEFPCNDHACPVDCKVSEWTAWGDCDQKCDFGTRTRHREVSVQPKDNGKWCPPIEDRNLCNVQACCASGLPCD